MYSNKQSNISAEVRPRSFFSLHANDTPLSPGTNTDHEVDKEEEEAVIVPGTNIDNTAKMETGDENGATGIVLHYFAARNEDELTLETGEQVELLQMPEGGWWEAKLKDVIFRIYFYLYL